MTPILLGRQVGNEQGNQVRPFQEHIHLIAVEIVKGDLL